MWFIKQSLNTCAPYKNKLRLKENFQETQKWACKYLLHVPTGPGVGSSMFVTFACDFRCSCFQSLFSFCRSSAALQNCIIFSRSPAWTDGPMVISSDESIAVLAKALLGNYASLCNWTQKKLTVALLLRWHPEDSVKLAGDLSAEL